MSNRHDLFARMEEEKDAILESVRALTKEERAFHPPSGWNALQILEHILISEKGTLGYMKKKTQLKAEEMEVVDDQSREATAQLVAALHSENRWSAPSVLPEPTGAHSLDALSEEWTLLRDDFRVFLHELPAEYDQRKVFNHPFSGRIGLLDTLDFLAGHIKHHAFQLDRLKQVLP
ncbi:MAG: hypothetical protein RL226_1175 [Bacteroidota bacterium]